MEFPVRSAENVEAIWVRGRRTCAVKKNSQRMRWRRKERAPYHHCGQSDRRKWRIMVNCTGRVTMFYRQEEAEKQVSRRNKLCIHYSTDDI